MARRYLHNLGRYQLLTGDMMKLYPIGLTEVIRNDTVQHSTNALIRFSPMAAPIMHPVTVRVHHFFVPHRLSWKFLNDGDCGEGWENFITGGPDGNDASTPPQMATTGVAKDLLDYLGLPRVAGINVNAMPVAAVNLIWNEYYRDQDLSVERTNKDVSIPAIAWEKDYFTSARPWPQKGPEITLPITGQAPVAVGKASTDPQFDYGIQMTDKTAKLASGGTRLQSSSDTAAAADAMFADLSQATAIPVTELRRALALQRMGEVRSRYGSRYTEWLRYYGVRSPSDARLQRPEFLGGGRVRMSISEVLQTGEGATPRYGVGDMYGHGVGAIRSNAYRRYFEEDGYIISLLSVRPKVVYTTGINRLWLRKDKEDFYQKELEFIGQQAIFNNELYADAAGGENVFGYADRYREYRENPSLVTGEFRDSTLNYWHLGREFTAAPALNHAFVYEPASKRIFQEQTQDSMWILVQHRMAARRNISKSAYGKII